MCHNVYFVIESIYPNGLSENDRARILRYKEENMTEE